MTSTKMPAATATGQSLSDLVRQLADMRFSISRNTWVYSSVEQICLDHGTEIAAVPVSALLEHGLDVGMGQPRECFFNAYRIAIDEPDLLYTEGYGLVFGIPMDHAWLTHKSTGQIIDPTWVGVADQSGEVESVAYLGVKFSAGFIVERSRVSGYPSVMLGNTIHHRHILTQGLNFEGDIAVGMMP